MAPQTTKQFLASYRRARKECYTFYNQTTNARCNSNFATIKKVASIRLPLFHTFLNRPPHLAACERCAYVSFLSTPHAKNTTTNDQYFTALRLLNYQLLHTSRTKTHLSIPFVVLVAPNVASSKRKTLEAEGAKVVAVAELKPETNWIWAPSRKPGQERSLEKLMKLKAWELDPITLDSSRTLLPFEVDDPNQPEIYAQPPPSYLFVSVPDTRAAQWSSYARDEDTLFTSGFFFIQPSSYLYVYYTLILNKEHSFHSALMEQGFLNHVHRKGRSMPWKEFGGGTCWNTNMPEWGDRKRCVSLQGPFWREEGGKRVDKRLVKMWRDERDRMEVFWEKRQKKAVGS
ncbi:hypothetical protein EJ08DRAFT_695573 [Tothia fuscella]|uniref:Uncharacterized protein n=1 Tax=Tothia fuscella TaxID=1048955 RepID=A0A9P4NWG4_9PEZI|nr:hypothetical protein EJ08DRAFT_695573 [Tothia fuscella]